MGIAPCIFHQVLYYSGTFEGNCQELDVYPAKLSDDLKAEYIGNIESNIKSLMTTIEENIAAKENDENIPETGKTVLRQQYALIKAIEAWVAELKNEISLPEL